MVAPARRRWRLIGIAGAAILAVAYLFARAGWVATPDSLTRGGAASRARVLRGADLTLDAACRAARVPPPAVHGRLKGSRVVVIKSGRLLTLFVGDVPVKEYAIGLGTAPTGDKEREGDRRTPEGEFYLCYRNPTSRFHRFLGISYPSSDDADRGLRQGLISRDQYRAITTAHAARRQPPWDTPLGGEVGIHGGGSGLDWTWGCIALENAAIEELDRALPTGTRVTIQP